MLPESASSTKTASRGIRPFDTLWSMVFASDAGPTYTADALFMANAPAALIARAIVILQLFMAALSISRNWLKVNAGQQKRRNKQKDDNRQTQVDCFRYDIGESKVSAMTVSLQFTRRTPCSYYMGRPIRFYETAIQVYILLSTPSARVSAPIVGLWVAWRLGRDAEQRVEVKIPVSRVRADSP